MIFRLHSTINIKLLVVYLKYKQTEAEEKRLKFMHLGWRVLNVPTLADPAGKLPLPAINRNSSFRINATSTTVVVTVVAGY